MLNIAAYAGLFSTAFIAATIFPLQSEAVLVGMLLSTKFSVVGVVIVASVGNTLGAMANWFLGRWIERFRVSLVPVERQGIGTLDKMVSAIRQMVAFTVMDANRRRWPHRYRWCSSGATSYIHNPCCHRENRALRRACARYPSPDWLKDVLKREEISPTCCLSTSPNRTRLIKKRPQQAPNGTSRACRSTLARQRLAKQTVRLE